MIWSLNEYIQKKILVVDFRSKTNYPFIKQTSLFLQTINWKQSKRASKALTALKLDEYILIQILVDN